MQKAINRFWDWLFHPGIRWYHYPKGKSAWFRYPSPGNVVQKQQVEDYKRPFQYSHYNIRYHKPVKTLTQQPTLQFIGHGIGLSTVDKLRSTKLLPQGNYTQQQFQQAKKKYQQKYGISAQQNAMVNTIGVEIPQLNRQSIRQNIISNMKAQVQLDRNLNMPSINGRYIQQPQLINLHSLDMFSAPHFQQTRLQVNSKLDNYAKQNAKRGYIEIRKGQRSFWKAIDDSNDPKNIEKVQKAIGDEQPNNFTLRNTKIQFELDEKGNAVDVHPQTKGI